MSEKTNTFAEDAIDRIRTLERKFDAEVIANAKLKKEIYRLQDQRRDYPRVCHWSEDADGVWNGSCGIAWTFGYETTPNENKMTYCPECGAVIIQESQPSQ